MVTNGALTSFTSLLIIAVIFSMLEIRGVTLAQAVPVFLFVLAVTTIFFFIIFRQGRRLRAEKEQMATVFERIADGVVILDDSMKVVQSNPAARRLLGMEEGQSTVDFCGICSNYPGVGKMCVYDQCFVAERAGVPVEVKVRSGGRDASVSVTTTHFTDADGRRRYILRVQEVADERKSEQERIAKLITHSILQAQENERKRISRELHDGIGQALYSASIQLDVAAELLSQGQDAGATLKRLQQHVRRTIEEVRHLSAELRPSVLDDMGLLSALRNYVQEFGHKFGIQVNFSYKGDKSRLPAAMETALYRIVQEALTNAAKYAKSERVDIDLIHEPAGVTLAIQDYGVGFDAAKQAGRGVGLYSMEERASILGGSFRVESAPGAGTRIMVAMPLRKGDAADGDSRAARG